MLGLDALYHVIPLVGKIVSERTHPYVLTTLVLLLTLMVLLLLIASAEALITRDLSRFGIRILSKSAMKQRTVAHSSSLALEPILRDKVLSFKVSVRRPIEAYHQEVLLQVYLKPQLFHPVFDYKHLQERKKMVQPH